MIILEWVIWTSVAFSLLERGKVVCVTLSLSLFCLQGLGLELVESVLTGLTQSQRGEVP